MKASLMVQLVSRLEALHAWARAEDEQAVLDMVEDLLEVLRDTAITGSAQSSFAPRSNRPS